MRLYLRLSTCVMLIGLMAVGGLWFRSMRTTDSILLFGPRGALQIISSVNGSITIVLTDLLIDGQSFTARRFSHPGRSEAFSAAWSQYAMLRSSGWIGLYHTANRPARRLGFSFVREEGFLRISGTTAISIGIPHWFPLAGFAMALVILIVRERCRSRRAREGYCRQCGYDLRASPERCPECGEPIPAITSPTSNVPALRAAG